MLIARAARRAPFRSVLLPGIPGNAGDSPPAMIARMIVPSHGFAMVLQQVGRIPKMPRQDFKEGHGRVASGQNGAEELHFDGYRIGEHQASIEGHGLLSDGRPASRRNRWSHEQSTDPPDGCRDRHLQCLAVQ